MFFGELKSDSSNIVDLIKKAISEAFPLLPVDIAKEVKVVVSKLGGVHKLRLQILPIIDHLPTSVYIG